MRYIKILGLSTESSKPFVLIKPLPTSGSSPLFFIVISSKDEEVNPQNSRKVIFAVPFPNPDEVSNEALKSLSRVLNEVFKFNVSYTNESNDDEFLTNVPPADIIVISYDFDEDSGEEGSSVDNKQGGRQFPWTCKKLCSSFFFKAKFGNVFTKHTEIACPLCIVCVVIFCTSNPLSRTTRIIFQERQMNYQVVMQYFVYEYVF